MELITCPPPQSYKQSEIPTSIYMHIRTVEMGEHRRPEKQKLELSAKKMLMRDEMTEATAAAFAGSAVIPDRFLWPDEITGRSGAPVAGDEESRKLIPVVDMASLLDQSQEEIAKLNSACRDWGFFQLVNHGVDETVVDRVKQNTEEFFKLPLEKKKAVGTSKAEGVQGFGHHFNTSTGKVDWAESLNLTVQPIEQRNMGLWPTDPPTFRDAVGKYSLEMTKLTSLLMASMATDLGVKPETLLETIEGKLQIMVLHNYPPCPHGADKVVGLPSHTDGLCLTVLLQVDTTPGLQVRKGDRWFPVRPLPGSFTVFVGDMLEVLTNGRYRSVEHRVLVHAERGRTSIGTFQDACVAGFMKPLLGIGEEARFMSVEKNDFTRRQYQALPRREKFIDSLKI